PRRRPTRRDNYPPPAALSHAQGTPWRAAAAPRPGGWSSAEEPTMRRVELPGGGDGPKSVVVVSYVPLLTGEPGRLLSVGDGEFTRLMVEADRCPSGLADACLWMAEGGGVFPVFVLPQAHAIAEHLLAWAEDRPGDWFVLCFAQRQGRYVAALFPNLPGSVERFKAAYFAAHGEPSRAAGYELLF